MEELTTKLLSNIREIRQIKGVSQEFMSAKLKMDTGNYSKIENGKQRLLVSHLGIIANIFECDVIDLFTYPKKYIDKDLLSNETERISVTFEISPDKRDILLSLITKKE